MLPNYLKFKTGSASPYKEQTVTIGDIRFTVITDRLIRIEQGTFIDNATQTVINRRFASPEFEQCECDGKLIIKTAWLELSYVLGEKLSSESLTIKSLAKPAFIWSFGDKPLQNLGGTVETLDQINGACPIHDGICSVDGYAVMDDCRTALFDEEGWFIRRPDGFTDIYFFGYGHDYVNCIKDYYRLTGAPKMMPKFVFGNWWSRYHKYTDVEYLDLMDKFAEHDIPLSVGIVDMDWHLTDGDGREYWTTGWTGYTWNEKYFPDYKDFIGKLHDRGLKTALNLHPALGVRHHEVQYEKMCKALGIDPETKAPVSFDCLNPEFLKAYFEILHFPYEDDGVDFWWLDWQQGTDYGWVHKNGGKVSELESITPLWMLNHMHYLASERDNKRGFIFSRFAGFGSQRYPLGFSGDSVTTWDSLDFQPYFTATASNIGYSWWSHDIGGHMGGHRDDEMIARWIQFGVFSPIFRLHSTQSIFASREPWCYNKRAELVMCDFMRLRHKLFPYIYTMSERNANDLVPLMQPMYHLYPEEKAAYNHKNEYFFGSELLVCPITSPADKVSDLGNADVWLPDGLWTDFFTGYVYKGGRELEAYRPLETMPLFIKAGGIVPMQVHNQKDNSLGNAEALEIIIAPGANGSFTLYEDDGESLEYTCGHFAKTKLTLDWTDNKATFTIHPTEGDLSLVPEKRNYKLVFRGFKKCGGHSYCSDTNSVIVELDSVGSANGASITLENCSGLVHDNSDCRARIVDILTRAQCEVEIKDKIMSDFEKYMSGGWIGASEKQGDEGNRLKSALYELASQNR